MSDTETHELITDQAGREASGAHRYGRYLEEFEVGAVYKHWPAKTVTESDDHLFCLITMNHHPLHLNDVYAGAVAAGPERRRRPARLLAGARDVGLRRLRQGDRQPRDRGAQPPEPRLPRRHALLRVRGARGPARRSRSPTAASSRSTPASTSRTGDLVAEFKRAVLIPQASRTSSTARPKATSTRAATRGRGARVAPAAALAAGRRALPRRARGRERDAAGAGAARRSRFGINPAGEAGALGPDGPGGARDRRARPAPRSPSCARRGRAVRRPPQPLLLVARARRAIRHFEKLTDRYTRDGYLVELQLRYHPRPDQEGNIDALAATSCARSSAASAPNPGVRALQVTNEVNFYAIAPDASDAPTRARARRSSAASRSPTAQRERLGYEQLEIGFNWAYRTDPNREANFWNYLRDTAGRSSSTRSTGSASTPIPGTIFPPVETADGYRDGMVNAMSVLRDCYLPIAGIPASVPIKVEENGYPTGPGRPELRAGRRDASRWSARSASSAAPTTSPTTAGSTCATTTPRSANFQHHYGILNDDYTPKPAFELYRDLVAELSR